MHTTVTVEMRDFISSNLLLRHLTKEDALRDAVKMYKAEGKG